MGRILNKIKRFFELRENVEEITLSADQIKFRKSYNSGVESRLKKPAGYKFNGSELGNNSDWFPEIGDLKTGFSFRLIGMPGRYYLFKDTEQGDILINTVDGVPYIKMKDYDMYLCHRENPLYNINKISRRKITSGDRSALNGFVSPMRSDLTDIWHRQSDIEFTIEELAERMGIPVDRIKVTNRNKSLTNE